MCMTPSGYAAHDLSLSIEWSAYVSKKANDGEIPTIGNNSLSGFVGDGIIEFDDFTYGRVCENVVVVQKESIFTSAIFIIIRLPCRMAP